MLYILVLSIAFLCLIFSMLCIFYGLYRCYFKSQKKILPKSDYATYREYILDKQKANYLKQTYLIETNPVYKNKITDDDSSISSDDSSISSDDSSISSDDSSETQTEYDITPNIKDKYIGDKYVNII
jgi:hypothetical protein